MIYKKSTADMNREEWLKERRNSIGGSEMGAILGLNKYASAYTVWAVKTGLMAESEDNEAMRQGRDLEDYVAQRFAEKSGLKVRRENYIIRNDDFPHVHANIDRRIVGHDWGVECKTANAYMESKFKNDEFPLSYYVQCVTYLAITGFTRWYLPVLVLGREFKVYQLTRIENDDCPEWCESSVYVDDNEIDALRKAAIGFWSHVVDGTPPPVDGSKATTDALSVIYADCNGETVDLFGADKVFKELAETKAAREELEVKEELLKQILKDELKTAEKGVCGSHIVTWKPQKRKTFDYKSFILDNPEIDFSDYFRESTFRVMKIKEAM